MSEQRHHLFRSRKINDKIASLFAPLYHYIGIAEVFFNVFLAQRSVKDTDFSEVNIVCPVTRLKK